MKRILYLSGLLVAVWLLLILATYFIGEVFFGGITGLYVVNDLLTGVIKVSIGGFVALSWLLAWRRLTILYYRWIIKGRSKG